MDFVVSLFEPLGFPEESTCDSAPSCPVSLPGRARVVMVALHALRTRVVAPPSSSSQRPAAVACVNVSRPSGRGSVKSVSAFVRVRRTRLCTARSGAWSASPNTYPVYSVYTSRGDSRWIVRGTRFRHKPRALVLDDPGSTAGSSPEDSLSKELDEIENEYEIPAPWHSFLTKTTLVVAAMVILYSSSQSYAVNDKGVSFAWATGKRLACVAAGRFLAKRAMRSSTVRDAAHRLGKSAGKEIRTIVNTFKAIFEYLKSFSVALMPVKRKDGPGSSGMSFSTESLHVPIETQKNQTQNLTGIKLAFSNAKAKYDLNPNGIMLIPVIAAFVGWFTNLLAVKMIFFPIAFLGVPLAQAVEGHIYGYPVLNPLGAFGWQGIVPAKAAQMALTMVEMVTTKLIDVQEVFLRLDPMKMAKLLSGEVPFIADGIARDLAPNWAVNLGHKVVSAQCGPLLNGLEDTVTRYLAGFVELVQLETHKLIDLKELVVTEMCEDKRTLVELFQRCGREELKFLTNSGLFFGFLLGCLQAAAWLFYDNPWTLTFGGAIVGLATNWIALKCIFEPVEPVYLFRGSFGQKLKIQGLFLQRQNEVSGEFSDHLASKVLTSEKVWDNLLTGGKSGEFEDSLKEYTKGFLTQEMANYDRGMVFSNGEIDPEMLDSIVSNVKARLIEHVHVLHEYSDETLGLKELMRERMALMTPSEFERVLHPIFEQDELTLIISGAVLGAVAGFVQQVYTVAVDGKEDEGEEGLLIAESADSSAGTNESETSNDDTKSEEAMVGMLKLRAHAEAHAAMEEVKKGIQHRLAESKAVAEATRSMKRWPTESSRDAGRLVWSNTKAKEDKSSGSS